MVNSWQDNQCQRVRILPYFEGENSVDENYKCGCCNVCSPELDFLDRVRPRPQNPSMEFSNIELADLLKRNILDIKLLRKLCDVFCDYRTDTYTKARHILEGNPNNLPALYLTREFSPPEELGANTKELLKRVNERMVPFAQLRELYETSSQQFKSEILLILNDQDTTCDSPAGWAFLVEEAENRQYYGNEQVESLHDCLEFFLIVKKAIPADMEHFRKKSQIMEGILNA